MTETDNYTNQYFCSTDIRWYRSYLYSEQTIAQQCTVYRVEGKKLMEDLYIFILLIRTIPQSKVSFIATVGCLSLALFLIAAMLVLALIPLYISEKNVSVNSGM